MRRAVFIDWDDTLGDWGTAARLAQEDVYQQFRIAEWGVRFEDWYEAYHAHNAELWHLYGHGQIDRPFLMMDRFLHPICAVKGIAKEDGEAFKPLAMEMSSLFLAQTNAHFRLLPDAREVVAYLAGKYALTVVSNGFAEVQHYKLEKSGLLPYFRHVVLSEEVGALKPGARIFEVAMEMNRRELPYLEKEEVVMVGDSWGSDIEGAMNAGIDAVWISPEPSAQALPEGVQTVRRLRDVMEVL